MIKVIGINLIIDVFWFFICLKIGFNNGSDNADIVVAWGIMMFLTAMFTFGLYFLIY